VSIDFARETNRFASLVGSKRGSIFELAFIVAVAISLALAVQSWAVKPYQIPSASMEPTLDVGQRVLVNRFSERLGGDPEIGDVTVFHPPVNAVPTEQGSDSLPKCGVQAPERVSGQACPRPGAAPAEENFIKRVVAGPGDQLMIIDGMPIVNGDAVKGDWRIIPCREDLSCDYPRAITIPPDHYFMMGDNRPSSDDSRFWGPVPRDWIIGQAFATYWPPQRIGSL
jgi:signal peptidase I